LLRRALTRLAKHELAELLTLDLAIDLVGELADMLGKHWLLRQLLRIVLLHVLELRIVGLFSVVDNGFDVVLQLLHNVLVLQL